MKLLVIALSFLFQFTPMTIKDMGYCADITSNECLVKDYWPRSRLIESVGLEAYWLKSNTNQVCFITRKQYIHANIGFIFDCLWRDRQS